MLWWQTPRENTILVLSCVGTQLSQEQRKEENNLTTALLIEPDNEEVLLMLMKIALKKSNYTKVKDLSQTFIKVCNKLCNENDQIQESLKNLEPKNES